MRNRAGDNKFGFDLTHAHRLNSRAFLPTVTIYSFARRLRKQVEVVTALA
jgi:hypothetical protein